MFVMRVSLSFWLVRLALFTLPPPSPDSSSGMTVIMHMAQQLQVWPHTSLILLSGGMRQPFWKPTNPYSAARALTMIWDWTREWSGDGNWMNELYEQRGELITLWVPREVCREGGDAFSNGAQQLSHGLIFETHPQDLRRNRFSTPPQWWQEASVHCRHRNRDWVSVLVKTVIPLQWFGN